MDHWLEEMWPPSTTDCNSLDYFMWCVVVREVNKCPHITLASIKVMTLDVVTDLDREVIILASIHTVIFTNTLFHKCRLLIRRTENGRKHDLFFLLKTMPILV
jgi:hypothetical protein